MILARLRLSYPLLNQLASVLPVSAVPKAGEDRYQKTGNPSRILGNEPQRKFRPYGRKLCKEVIEHRKGCEIIRLRLNVFQYPRSPLCIGIRSYRIRKLRSFLSSFLF